MYIVHKEISLPGFKDDDESSSQHVATILNARATQDEHR